MALCVLEGKKIREIDALMTRYGSGLILEKGELPLPGGFSRGGASQQQCVCVCVFVFLPLVRVGVL